MSNRWLLTCQLTSVLALGVASCPTFAAADQSSDTTPARPTPSEQEARLDEIVVTAQKRESTVQTTPIALSALDASALETNHITDLSTLPLQVPSLYVGGGDGFGSNSVTIRGIGSLAIGVGADEGVGVYVDGVYQGKPYGNIFEFVDIDRIEVLRGPQGTLYGRNATGGAINIVTKQPGDELAGLFNAEYTNYDGVRVSGYALVPLQDNFSLKVAAGSETRNGWAFNPTRNEHPYAVDDKYGSAALRWRPADGTDITLSARVGRTYSSVALKDANDKTLPWNIFNEDYPNYEDATFNAVNLSITQNLGFAQLVSITGYEGSHARDAQDSDLTPAYYFEFNSDQKSRQISEELRLVSQGESRFNWIAGVQYFHENADVFLPFQITIASLGVLFDAHLKTNSYAAFAEGTYKFTDKLSATVGGRYNEDQKDWLGCVKYFTPGVDRISPNLCAGSATQPDNRSWGSFTPRFVLNYQLDQDRLLYVSATKGFRSGGWNFTDATSYHSGFNPEDIWSYEGGLKSEWLSNRLRVNLAGFYGEYSHLQVRINDGPFLATRNAGSARIYGAELESVFRAVRKLDLSLIADWLNAKYTQFSTNSNGVTADYAGNYLSRAPEFTVTVAGQYGIDLNGSGTLIPRAEYHHVAEVFYSQENIQPQGAAPYNQVNVRLKYEPPMGHWSLTAFADNVTSQQFREHTFPGNLPGQVAASYSTPRIFGLRGQYNW